MFRDYCPVLIVTAFCAFAAPVESEVSRTCALPGFSAEVAAPWYAEEINSQDPVISGCHMYWEQNGLHVAVMTLLAFDLRDKPPPPDGWESVALTVESRVLEQLSFTRGELLWGRESVVIAGGEDPGARTVAWQMLKDDKAHPYEDHMIFFERGPFKYLLSLITPSRSSDQDAYSASVRTFAEVAGTLQPDRE